MEFTRQRREKRSINEKYIVHSHVSIFTRIVNILVSVIMWAYMFIIIEVFVSACIDYNNDHLRLLKTTLKVTNDKLQQIIIGALIIFAIKLVLPVLELFPFLCLGFVTQHDTSEIQL